jgi:hypothetical protein
MKHGQGLIERIMDALGRLSQRELVLVLILVISFPSMGIWTVFNKIGAGTEAIESEIESYERAIRLLVEQQTDLAERLERAELFRARIENGEELQLHGFLERECVESSVDRPSSYADNITPINDPQTREVVMQQIQTIAEISRVDPLPLSRLLHNIANSDELVYLRAIDLQPARGHPDQYRVRLTLTTFRSLPDS